MKYYVYELAEPDGRVFYVGKGSRNRLNDHEQELLSKLVLAEHDFPYLTKKEWAIYNVALSGQRIIKRKVFETDDECEALRVERAVALKYEQKQLTNTKVPIGCNEEVSKSFGNGRRKPVEEELIGVIQLIEKRR